MTSQKTTEESKQTPATGGELMSTRENDANKTQSPALAAFSDLLARVRHDVDSRLAGYLDSRVADMVRHGADVEAMGDAIRDLTLRGGKRLRAALLMVGYQAENDSLPEEPALDAGVAFELLQTYLLIHDDWMDDDELRRGGPSVPAMLRKHHGSRHLGDAAAVLAGDFAAALSLDVLSRLDAPADRLVKTMGVFAQIQQDVICGQQLDVTGRITDLETYYCLKTGSYTVKGPLVIGATLGGASADMLVLLEDYARPLGIAFQMRDDLLGIFGAPSTTGKPVGADLRRGCHTIVVEQARAMLGSAELRRFEQVFGNPSVSTEALVNVTRMLEECGVRSAVQDRVTKYAADAVSVLKSPLLSEKGRLWLEGTASLVASRVS